MVSVTLAADKPDQRGKDDKTLAFAHGVSLGALLKQARRAGACWQGAPPEMLCHTRRCRRRIITVG